MSEEKQEEIKKKFYKRWWFWVIVVFVVIILASAGNSDKSTTAPLKKTSTNVSDFKEIPTIYSINQNVKVGDVRWRLISVKDRGNILKSYESRYPTIAEDKKTTGRFIEITMEVENLGTEMKTVSNLKIVDDRNREFTSSSDVSEWISEGKELFILSNLNPNMPQQFADIYEVPVDAVGLKIKVGDLTFWGDEEALINLEN